jgi:branched-subunit amino acid ABC-type transport system permease component
MAACAPALDPEQTAICSGLTQRLHAPTSQHALERVGLNRAQRSIRIDYRETRSNGSSARHVLICDFAGSGLDANRLELLAVSIDGEQLGPSALYFLRRYGQIDPAARTAQGGETLPTVPLALAIVVQFAIGALPAIAVYALLAPAYALIYGLIGRIHFAFGEFLSLSSAGMLLGVAGASAAGLVSVPVLLSVGVGIGLLVAAVHGDAAARFVMLPMARRTGLSFLVATIGLSIALQEYIRLAQGTRVTMLPNMTDAPTALLRADTFIVMLPSTTPVVALISLTGAAATLFAVHRTRFGRSWRAVSDDPGTAALFGVAPERVLRVTGVLSALLAGLAGLVVTLHYGGVGFAGGLAFGLKALVAAILGGIGSVHGALLGAVLLGTLEAIWSATLPIALKDAAIYGLLAALLALRPGGLLGDADLSPRRV